MRKVVIVSAKRSAIGSFGGALKDVSAVKLGVDVLKNSIQSLGIEPDCIDEVILGNVLSAGLGQNVARQILLNSGIKESSTAFTVNHVCGSGLKSVQLGFNSIALGDSDVVVVGGVENMSMAPYLLPKARYGYKMGDGKIVDSMIQDGLTCATNNYHMGITAENLCDKYAISREEQDKFSALSQQKAIQAIKQGKFKDEIVPIKIPTRKGEIVFDTDEFPRDGVTKESLAKIRPAFKKDGSVSAGSSSGINDGAAILILMSEEKAKELGLKPLVSIEGFGVSGVDPSIMGIGPIKAVQGVLKKTNLNLDDIDVIEANEAFAAQSIAVDRELHFDKTKLNINGGAIALGHPIGASGARILVTLIHEMQKQKSNLGLATLCIGGGQGIATIVKNIHQ